MLPSLDLAFEELDPLTECLLPALPLAPVAQQAEDDATCPADQLGVGLRGSERVGAGDHVLALADDASAIGQGGDHGTAVFHNLPLSSIKEFRLQLRPYRCVEFGGISLQPGQKSQVTAISYNDPANDES